MAKTPTTKAAPPVQTAPVVPGGGPTGAMAEIGVSGLRVASGYVFEEFLPELRGRQGILTYRQMSDNDSTIGAILHAIMLVLRGVDWTAIPNEDAPDKAQAEAEALFAESLLDDMSSTFEDFIAEALSFLVYGFSYFEMVLKRRAGPLQTDPSKRSKFEDGRVGIRKLAPRSQDSMLRWEMQEDGGIAGMWQIPPVGGGTYFIPIERALLFRSTSRKNNPEGVSALRGCYRAWFFLSRIQEIEAIGIERDLAGLPVVSIPSRYFKPDAAAADVAVRAQYEKIARDLKFNEQGAIVIPSDMYPNPDGTISSSPLVKIELVKTAGSKSIDPNVTKEGYKRDIANSVLAGFILLGSDSRGSYALSKDKTDFFLKACKAFLGQIKSVLNRYMLPRIWDYNGLDRALLPAYEPGELSTTDLGVLGTYLQQLSAAGMVLFPDEDLENTLRDEADLPPKSAEAQAAQDADKEAATAATQAMADAKAKDTGSAAKPAGADAGGVEKSDLPFDKAFNDGEARDAGGRWISGGGGASGAVGIAAKAFSEQQRVILGDYKAGGFKAINDHVSGRSLNHALGSEVKTIDGAFNKSRLSEDTTLWRGIDHPGLVKNAEKLIGREVPVSGFPSTSHSRGVAEGFAGYKSGSALLKIDAPKGSRAINMDQFESGASSGEKEVLLPRTGSMKITHVDRSGRIPVIHGTWIDHDVKKAEEVIGASTGSDEGQSRFMVSHAEINDWLAPVWQDIE